MTITRKEEEDLLILEKKIMRTRQGPIQISQTEFRRTSNGKIKRELKN